MQTHALPLLPLPYRAAGVADRHRGDPRHDHVGARHHDRQRRSTQPVSRPACPPGQDPVGDHRLSALAGGGHPGHRLGGPALRGAAPVPHRADRVHRRLSALRPGLVERLADRLPGAPGRRGRNAHADRPDRPGQGRRPAQPPAGHERHRGADRAGARFRTHAGRPAAPGRGLAMDLHHQRSRGDLRLRHGVATAATRQRRGGRPSGLPRARARGGGNGGHHLWPVREQRRRQPDRLEGAASGGRRSGAGGELRAALPSHRAAAAGRAPVFQPRLRRRFDGDLLPGRGPCSAR